MQEFFHFFQIDRMVQLIGVMYAQVILQAEFRDGIDPRPVRTVAVVGVACFVDGDSISCNRSSTSWV